MDIVVEYHCGQITLGDKETAYNHVKAGIGCVSIRLTNKEI
jgi:hypothetical protein